jgi:hypothetical protein
LGWARDCECMASDCVFINSGFAESHVCRCCSCASCGTRT